MRRFAKLLAIALALLLVAAGIVWVSLDKEQRSAIANLPTNRDVLFWESEQRDALFRAMDRLPWIVGSNTIAAGTAVRELPQGEPLDLPLDLDGFMASQNSAAIVVVHDGKLVLERYGNGFGPDGRWTSFSVAKSLTSTLVGAAIADGYIGSIDDPVTRYVEGLQGSAYEGVTIRQVLTMSSGVEWNEDYADPASDVARFLDHKPAERSNATVSYLSQLPRAAAPGTSWNYNTGETNLIGVLVQEATGKPLAQYLSEKVWAPYGMQQDATWLTSDTGEELGGCCIQAATRDMARFGLFVLDNGVIDGKRVVPEGWFAEATAVSFATNRARRSYGYQWWPFGDGTFEAGGIFGQGIFIDPARKLVIASNANWPGARDDDGKGAERHAFYMAVQAAIDAREKANSQAGTGALR